MTLYIICVAITGSLPTKADNPVAPISISEPAQSSNAFAAGATIAHCQDFGIYETEPPLT